MRRSEIRRLHGYALARAGRSPALDLVFRKAAYLIPHRAITLLGSADQIREMLRRGLVVVCALTIVLVHLAHDFHHAGTVATGELTAVALSLPSDDADGDLGHGAAPVEHCFSCSMIAVAADAIQLPLEPVPAANVSGSGSIFNGHPPIADYPPPILLI